MNDDATMLSSYVEQRLNELEATPTPSPTPEVSPSPSPEISPSPLPTPTPLPVQDMALIAVVQQVSADTQRIAAEQEGTRIASSGTFIALCLVLCVLIAMMLFNALRGKK